MYRALLGKPEERDHLEDQGVDGRMGLELILGRLAGCCECGDDPSDQAPRSYYY
jgi:hypothetical protein